MSDNETHKPSAQPQRRDGGFAIRNETDFDVIKIYLPSLQTRSDGRSGFYYYAEDRDNGLKFVPALPSIQPYAHYLRKRLPFFEEDLAKGMSTSTWDDRYKTAKVVVFFFVFVFPLHHLHRVFLCSFANVFSYICTLHGKAKAEVETIRKKLDDPDFDDNVQRQSLTNKMGTLELHIKSQFKQWEQKARELDDEEDKGHLIYYSTKDTDGVIVDEDKIYHENPKLSEDILAEEAVQVQEENEQIHLNEYTIPSMDCGIFTDDHAEDCKRISFLKQKWTQEKIERESRGDLYDLSGEWWVRVTAYFSTQAYDTRY